MPERKVFKLSYREPRTKFYQSFNGLLYKTKYFKDEIVLLNLVNSFCKPYLFYGIVGVSLSASYVCKLEKRGILCSGRYSTCN